MYRFNGPNYLKLSLVTIGLFGLHSAYAAGFEINELSPTIQAAALSDAATASGDISGMAYNPATLASIKGTEIYIGGSWIIPKVGYNNAVAVVTPTGPGTAYTVGPVTSENNVASQAFVPNAYFGYSVTDQFKVGVGEDSPWGLKTNYDDNWAGSLNAIESSIKTINLFPTMAYQLTSKLDVGASVDFEYIDAVYSNNFYNTEAGGLATVSGYNKLTGSAWSTGYTVGASYQLTPSTLLGADYHSSINESISGTANITGTVCFPGGCLPPGTFVPGYGTDPAAINLTLPATANFGVSQAVTDRLTLMADAQWTQWDTIQAIDVDVTNQGQDNTAVGYKNSWLYSLGAKYKLDPKWTLLGGLAYDQTPSNDQLRDPRIPDTNRKWVTMGFTYSPIIRLNLFMTYEHIFMNDQSINVTQQPSSQVATSKISANYNGYANILSGGLSYTF